MGEYTRRRTIANHDETESEETVAMVVEEVLERKKQLRWKKKSKKTKTLC